MTARAFILRGLRHYRAGYVGVLLGSALGAMVLLGALFAGDSVKHTLRTIAGQRTGQVEQVLVGGENFFRAQLADDLSSDSDAAAVLQLRGQADTADGRSTGHVDLLGVTPAFWSFAPEETAPPELDDRDFAINSELARTLDLTPGDSLVIRLRKPSLLASDAPLSGSADDLITIRGTITRIVADEEMGRFSLTASQLPEPKIFLPLERLAEAIDQPGRANLMLLRSAGLRTGIAEAMQPADYSLTLQEIPLADAIEIRTERVFLPPAIEDKLRTTFPDADPVITYLVNTLAANDRETPYSMVTGVTPGAADFIPSDFSGDQIILNSWEAEDLAAGPGDEVTLSYYVLYNNELVEQSHDFTVRAVVPFDGLAADPRWMPDFPGIAEAENNSDWTPGMPMDLDRIRDKDETYWDEHRGAPKAFIPYETASRIWENRWGAATGLRVPADTPDLEARILSALSPADAGLAVRDIAAEAERAAASPTDIASLFLSMSFFLILAAVALTAMLFRFNVEQRNAESGLLAALGISAKKILRWRLAEGAVVVLLGSLIGCGLAFLYTRGLLLFLERIWSAGSERLFVFHAAPTSIIGGILGFAVLAMLSIWWVTRRQAKRSASLRLSAGAEEIIRPGKSRARWVAAATAIAGLAALIAAPAIGPQGAFFLGGFCFLAAGLAIVAGASRSRPWSERPTITPAQLARLNLARRPARTLVAVGSLAAGVFLVISVTAFQKHGGDDWREKSSGTGGFALWIETTLPIPRGEDGKPATMRSDAASEVVACRLGTGDDASCFNLNSVARPRLIATDVSQLEDRFTIKSTLDGIEPSWSSLETADNEVLPAFVDETTLLWALKLKLGDTIEYLDEAGNPFPVQIVGTLADSVFQGSLIVDERAFLKRFPAAVGHRLFLAETSPGTASLRLATTSLQRDLADLGATITPTQERLAAFHGVENTYITIFNILGGLGVILGSAGLGIVLARNLAERRDELEMLHTIGIGHPVIRGVVRREARTLIAWALGVGLVAALISIIPALPDTGLLPTLGAIALFTVLILITATLSAWLAIRSAALR